MLVRIQGEYINPDKIRRVRVDASSTCKSIIEFNSGSIKVDEELDDLIRKLNYYEEKKFDYFDHEMSKC